MGAVLILAVLIGLIPAAIAQSKGRSFLGWWIFGAMLFIVALPVSLVVSSKRHRCPQCDEPISKRARVCPHCRSQLA